SNRTSAKPRDPPGPCGCEFANLFRLIFVNHDTLSSVHLASRSVNNDASSRPDQMLVDFSAGFIDIMDCLAEYIADRILFPFTADDDSFSRLIRCYCAVRARG